MNDAALPISTLRGEDALEASRWRIVRVLGDVVTAPGARLIAQERELAADVLLGLIHDCPRRLRQRLATRLAALREAPKALLRALARQEIDVAGPLLRDGAGFDESDLVAVIAATGPAHARVIATRKGLGPAASDAILKSGDVAAVQTLLRNAAAQISPESLGFVLKLSRDHDGLVPALLARPELQAAHAHMLFWWANGDQRRTILKRFAVGRDSLTESLAEIFPEVVRLAHLEPKAGRVLEILDRRQVRRSILARIGAESLDSVALAAMPGGRIDADRLGDLALCAGVRASTLERVLADAGGEAIAVFAKAAGIKRETMARLWRAQGRALDPAASPGWGAALHIFDTLPVAKAQTVLRYWNFSFVAEAEREAELYAALAGHDGYGEPPLELNAPAFG
jgi:uncharacterized protein (DUF2336 family)